MWVLGAASGSQGWAELGTRDGMMGREKVRVRLTFSLASSYLRTKWACAIGIEAVLNEEIPSREFGRGYSVEDGRDKEVKEMRITIYHVTNFKHSFVRKILS